MTKDEAHVLEDLCIQLRIQNLQQNAAEAFVLLFDLLIKLRKYNSLLASQKRMCFS